MEESTAFKNLINAQVVKVIGEEIVRFYPDFNSKEFNKISSQLTALELKERVLLIAASLKKHLPDTYTDALKIILKVLKTDRLDGFSLWPFSEYIGQNGLDHFDESMNAMFVLTQKFTSEFAVRSFFIKDHSTVLKYFNKWSTDKNHHVRRWVSEGSRPLLPWGQRIPEFVKKPDHTIGLLDKLKYDDELYVRKSVANHLNDISKHHPKFVVKILRDWKKNCPSSEVDKINWIQKHALRTLIKKGDADALKLMGVDGKAQIKVGSILLNKSKLKLDSKLEFEFEVISTSKKSQKLVIDYLIHFRKANGSLKPKVYKLKTLEIAPGERVVLKKAHSLRPITTMVYYPGIHEVSIQINGKKYPPKSWLFEFKG